MADAGCGQTWGDQQHPVHSRRSDSRGEDGNGPMAAADTMAAIGGGFKRPLEPQVTLKWKHSTDGVDWEELSALYRAAPLGEKKPLHLQKVFSNSMFKCFVYENTKLVAVGRALADGADCSYICDIAVLPSHQGTGLGKQVVSNLVEMSGGHKKIILYAVPGKEPFYRKFGFMRMKTAMGIFENQQQQVERGYLSEA